MCGAMKTPACVLTVALVPRVLLGIFLQGNGGARVGAETRGGLRHCGRGGACTWVGVMETHLQERQLIPSGTADGAASQARGR